jgi:hypothetical protein
VESTPWLALMMHALALGFRPIEWETWYVFQPSNGWFDAG